MIPDPTPRPAATTPRGGVPQAGRQPTHDAQLLLLTDSEDCGQQLQRVLNQSELDFQDKRTKFLEFHREHPSVFDSLVEHSLEELEAGMNRHGFDGRLHIQAIYAVVASHYRRNVGVRLSNNHMPFYARLMSFREPRLRGHFKLNPQTGAPKDNQERDQQLTWRK